MSKLDVTVIRIDPFKKRAALLKITGRDFTAPMKRLTRARQLGHRHLIDIEDNRIIGYKPDGKGGTVSFDAGPQKLYVAADAQTDKGVPGWRLRGGKTTVGYSVLFGATGAGTVAVPVDLEWVAKHLVWVDASTADAEAEKEDATAGVGADGDA